MFHVRVFTKPFLLGLPVGKYSKFAVFCLTSKKEQV